MAVIPAQLVGGPRHGDRLYVESSVFDVPIQRLTTSLAEAPSDLSIEDLSIETGRYRARLRMQVYGGGAYVRSEFDRLPNGMVPFDYEGPGGPTWHERLDDVRPPAG